MPASPDSFTRSITIPVINSVAAVTRCAAPATLSAFLATACVPGKTDSVSCLRQSLASAVITSTEWLQEGRALRLKLQRRPRLTVRQPGPKFARLPEQPSRRISRSSVSAALR